MKKIGGNNVGFVLTSSSHGSAICQRGVFSFLQPHTFRVVMLIMMMIGLDRPRGTPTASVGVGVVHIFFLYSLFRRASTIGTHDVLLQVSRVFRHNSPIREVNGRAKKRGRIPTACPKRSINNLLLPSTKL
jgi:hypothetical protein